MKLNLQSPELNYETTHRENRKAGIKSLIQKNIF